MKIIIVITFYDRHFQLNKTLNSIAKTKHDDFEVIIVDDCSPAGPLIGKYNFAIEIYKTKNKRWICSAPAFNIGIEKALKKNPDVIILQNAENYHVGDVINYATKINDQNYISFACYNLSGADTFNNHNINDIIKRYNNHALNNEDNAWLNHKVIRPKGYHWCAAISANNMRKLNGFDERFSDGYCFDDDEFIARVKMLDLDVEITDYPFVVHQWHERNYVPENWNELFKINEKLFEWVQKIGNPIAIHKFTKNFYA